MDIHSLGPKSRLRSFRYAFKGLRALFKGEPNAWIHLSATIAVLLGAWWFDFSSNEWALVIFAIGIVFAAEALNSSIEALCDYACREQNPIIGKSKDLAAAGVLIAAIMAATIGAIIFLPKIVILF